MTRTPISADQTRCPGPGRGGEAGATGSDRRRLADDDARVRRFEQEFAAMHGWTRPSRCTPRRRRSTGAHRGRRRAR
ncbi:hypothetical protein HBB16_11430 [Pseudonocardia sp. MCCB 268]|nr:hypothetical protein [Pseudonocardia cytotoxica]